MEPQKPQPPPQPKKAARRLWPLIVGIAAFGALMVWRHDMTATWARAILAGCAFAVLVWGVDAARGSGS